MTCSVYVLLCSDGSLYTGMATDPQKRFRIHRAGHGALYTRMHRPERILAVVEYPDRRAASSCERALKKLGHDKKWFWIAAVSGDHESPDLTEFPEILRAPIVQAKVVSEAGGSV